MNKRQLFDIRKRSLLSILNSIPPSSPIEKKIEIAYWQEKPPIPNSRENSLLKQLRKNKAILKFESHNPIRHKSHLQLKSKRLECLGSPKLDQRKYKFQNNHKSGENSQRISLVTSQQMQSRSPNYSSNTEKRLFKGCLLYTSPSPRD